MLELLIRLVIWLFRELFGDSEPQARVGPRPDRYRDKSRRGPYNYGDGRPPSRPPKTLAELMSAARQKTEQAQGRRDVPVTRAEVRAVQVAPVARPKIESALPPTFPSQSRAPRPKASRKKAPRPRKQPRVAPVPTENAPPSEPGFHGFRSADPSFHGFELGTQGVGGKAVPVKRKVVAPVSGALRPLLEELKAAEPEKRRLAGVRAMAASMIFEPPRCRRHWAPRMGG